MSNEIFNAVKVASDVEEIKLLDRDERKEFKELRSILQELSGFQIRFVEAYVKTASAAQAARMAGSKAQNPEVVGYNTLKNEKVQQAIAIAMKKRIEAVGLDTVEVIQKIREVYNAALEANNFMAAVKACELLQKEIDKAKKVPLTTTESSRSGSDSLAAGSPSTEAASDIERVVSILSKGKVVS